MNKKREPEDHEEVIGGNHHNDDDPYPEGTFSTMENTGGAMTPSGVPMEEDRVGPTGSANQDLIYHINRKVVTEEEWTMLTPKNG